MKLPHLLKQAVDAAQAALGERSRIEGAISDAKQELPAALRARLEAEADLSRSEANEVLGRGNGNGAAAGARRALTDAREACDGLSARIVGLHNLLLTAESERALEETLGALKRELPQYAFAIADEFEREWHAASAAWAKTLAKRNAIENVLGYVLELDIPAPPSTVEDGAVKSLQHCWGVLEDVQSTLSSIASAKTMANRNRIASTYDPAGVYEVVQGMLINGKKYEPRDVVLGASVPERLLKIALERRQLRRADALETVTLESENG